VNEIFVACVRKLFFIREYLTNQKGQYRDPNADDYLYFSWSGFCTEIGISYQAANNWIKKFTPREISSDGKDQYLGSIPPGFAAALWWLEEQKQIKAAGQRRRA